MVMQQQHCSPALHPLCPGISLRPIVLPHRTCRVFSLEEMVAAHEYAEQGHVRGKVGIEIKKLPE